jgi:hypothetical protein
MWEVLYKKERTWWGKGGFALHLFHGVDSIDLLHFTAHRNDSSFIHLKDRVCWHELLPEFGSTIKSATYSSMQVPPSIRTLNPLQSISATRSDAGSSFSHAFQLWLEFGSVVVSLLPHPSRVPPSIHSKLALLLQTQKGRFVMYCLLENLEPKKLTNIQVSIC